jgi:hypothetical protein
MLEMTCTTGFDQKLYPGVWNRTMNWKEMHWWEEDYGTNSDDGHSVNENFEKLENHEKLHKEGQAKIKAVLAEWGYKVDEHGKDDAAEDVEVDKERDNHNHDYWESIS